MLNKNNKITNNKCELKITEEGDILKITPKMRNCRNCKNFLRINTNEVIKQGFCMLGGNSLMERGDFSPFVSSSVSDYCDAFELDLNKFKITEEEYNFDNKAREYGYRVGGDRAKAIERAMKKDKVNQGVLGSMFLEQELINEEIRNFKFKNYEEWQDIMKKFDIEKKNWIELVDLITLIIKNKLKLMKEP